MKQQLTFRQYRTMDVFFFTLLLCVCESLIVLAGTRWFPGEAYTLSLTSAVTAIVLVRWGIFAAVPALAGGLVLSLVSGAGVAQMVIYCLGNMTALVLIPLIRCIGWKRLRADVLLTLLHGFTTALMMQLGRAAIALALGYAPAICLGFITTDVLSTLFAMLLPWICRRLNGMLEYQPHYLKRIQEEMERNGEA